MGQDLDNAAVLLTGASSGIGAALALALARRGARLALLARREDRLVEVAGECAAAGAPDVRIWAVDLSDLDAAERYAREADGALGGLDVLVNNAGAPMRKPVDQLTNDRVERTMRLNFLSPARMTLAVLPGMLERGRGSIVNVASLGGRLGILSEAAYSASKFAMVGWSEAMAADLHGTGVEVRIINPGAIETEIWDQPDNDPPFYQGALEPAADVADGIVAAIEGDRIEHYLPDMKAIIEFKDSDLDAFVAGLAAQKNEDIP
jgi:short-subunit dehydrogenase